MKNCLEIFSELFLTTYLIFPAYLSNTESMILPFYETLTTNFCFYSMKVDNLKLLISTEGPRAVFQLEISKKIFPRFFFLEFGSHFI